jgi:Domain of unknown function (DUF4112)
VRSIETRIANSDLKLIGKDMRMAHASFYDNSLTAEARIARLRRLAWLIDGAFRLPGSGFRFGLNSVIGLAPAAGDALLTAISLYIVYEARQLGLPKLKLARMLKNVAIEAAAGAVPVLGDLFDVAFKANLRNLAILEEHFGIRPQARTLDLRAN